MKRTLFRTASRAAAVAAGALCLAGCAWAPSFSMPTVPVQPPPGFLFTQYSAPLDHEFSNGGVGTPIDANASVGEAKAQYLFIPLIGFLSFAWGDASIDAAARNGMLREVHHADYDQLTILGIYTEFTTKAYGTSAAPAGTY